MAAEGNTDQANQTTIIQFDTTQDYFNQLNSPHMYEAKWSDLYLGHFQACQYKEYDIQ